MRLPTLSEAGERLRVAEEAFETEKRARVRLDDLIVRDAGCPEQCAECRLDCSIMWACVEHVRGEYEEARARAVREAGAVFLHKGQHYDRMEGRA